MGIHTVLLPDVGEGIAEAEIAEWSIAVGDEVREDDILGSVMTDKAAVEIPSTVSGRITWLCGTPGDMIPIGSKYVQLDVLGEGNDDDAEPPLAAAETSPPATQARETPETPPQQEAASEPVEPSRNLPLPALYARTVLASPAVRKSARDAGIDLRLVAGSGPAGRVTRRDLHDYRSGGAGRSQRAGKQAANGERETRVIGMRKRIADRMTLSKGRIAHITVVEEVDVSSVEELRAELNTRYADSRGKLTLLPFVATALVATLRAHPKMNAHFDDDADLIREFDPAHIGIATQTPNGLTVPVIKHAEAMTLWEQAKEIARLSDVARSGKATRDELTGSTITITSLGPLGAIATTPIINHPEVAIIGVNKIAVRPIWDGSAFQPRKMMNLSCSFDHRVIDGWDAALFVQSLKGMLEAPAMMFVEA